MTPSLKEVSIKLLDKYARGRPEFYLTILYLGYKLLKPGGLGLFVIPQSFLVNNNASAMRDVLSKNGLIRAIIDLSSIEVFEGVGAHVILLVFEKATDHPRTTQAIVATVSGLPGHALEQISDRILGNDSLYQISSADQRNFSSKPWVLLSNKEYQLKIKIEKMPKFSSFVKSTQGIVTGRDAVFIRDLNDIPEAELDIYIPLLPDKKIRPYLIDYTPERYIFYPILNNEIVTEDYLTKNYPLTHAYLLEHQIILKKDKNDRWWIPHRLRDPDLIKSSKIVAPHLLITPKFALDLEGKWGLTRSSSFSLKTKREDILDNDILKILTAIMNSSPFNWYNSIISQKYGGGYTMIENKTINQVPIPDLNKIMPKDAREIVNMVDNIMKYGLSNESLDRIDLIICKLYDLSIEEIKLVGAKYEYNTRG